jgi:hypothetical protein
MSAAASRLRILLFVAPVLAAAPALAAPPSSVGSWSPAYAWPNVAIHLHVLPDGHVLTFADDDNPNYPINGTRLAGSTKTFIVDIPSGGAPGTVVSVPNTRTNMFCSGHSFLYDGRLLVIGGHLGRDGWGEPHTDLFDYRGTYTWSAGDDMYEGRWYPSGCQLANGDVLAISGTLDTLATSSAIPEVWSPTHAGGWRQLTNAVRVLPYYPFTFLAPDGRVFCAGPGQDTNYLDCDGLGAWQFVANHLSNYQRSYAGAVQYGDGKYLVVGGGDPPTSTCEVIDLNQPTPAWTSTGAMQFSRRHLNATMLPDGTVLTTGGTSGGGFNSYTGFVLAAELWNPGTGAWTKMASMVTPRLYHSTSALLPDGRVLCTGGGRPKPTNGGADYLNAEIYSPPYLFKGTRPTITGAPTLAVNGASITINTPDAAGIAKVTLIGLTTTTHAFNMGQHFSSLPFTVLSGALQATLPANPTLLPPGYYMLFIVNTGGVPSISSMIQVLPPGTAGVKQDPRSQLLDFMALCSENPATHGEARIAFTLARSDWGRLDVFDVGGRLVNTLTEGYFEAGREQTVTWKGTDLSGTRVSSGVYWYRLQTSSVTLTGKVAMLSR